MVSYTSLWVIGRIIKNCFFPRNLLKLYKRITFLEYSSSRIVINYIWFCWCYDLLSISMPQIVYQIVLQHLLLGSKKIFIKNIQTKLLHFLKALLDDITYLGHFSNITWKFDKYFIKSADFRTFSETTEDKKDQWYK